MSHRPRRPSARALAGLLAAGLAWAAPVVAQSPEYDAPPARGGFEPADPPPTRYAVPDVPSDVAAKATVREHWFTLKPGISLLEDYNLIGQDPASLAQVGRQESQWDLRSARGMLRGTIGAGYKVSYLIAGEYRGFETAPENLWNLTDVSFTFPLGGEATKLTVGKTKEPFGYEMVGDAANLPHQERALSPFFVSRSVGLKVSSVLGAEHRMTLTAGFFNDRLPETDALSVSGEDVAVRITGLPIDGDEGTRFLHLGVAGRWAGADEGTLRFRSRPASNVTDYFVDTGKLEGDHSLNLGLEALWNEGPYSVLAEYMHAWLDAAAAGDPAFSGYYVTASWVLTGETRKYDRTVGYARRVMPTGRWGAPELVARYAHEDLDDGPVAGGSFDLYALGLNWWATRRAKAGVNWQHVRLDRFGAVGDTDLLLFRLQYIY